MYFLTKFFEKKSYLEDFVNGNLYLSSLSAFTKTYAERELREAAARGDKYAENLLKKQNNRSQRDVFEGTMASIPPDQVVELPADMRKVMCTDIMIRALGYDYCNVMCFCKLEYRLRFINGRLAVERNEPDMKAFGEYTIIVINPEEFIRRIDIAIRKQGYQYICGDVNYHPMTFNNGLTKYKHSMTLALDKYIDIEDILRRGKRIDYDAFDKCDTYKNQHEWRIVVNNGVADEQPLRINAGDLSDIVVKVKSEDLATKMKKLLLNLEIHPMKEGYSGNISRAEMREDFYRMGENKGNLMITIG